MFFGSVPSTNLRFLIVKAVLSCSVSSAMPVHTSAHSATTWDLHWVQVHTWWNCAARDRVHSVNMRCILSMMFRMPVMLAKEGNRAPLSSMILSVDAAVPDLPKVIVRDTAIDAICRGAVLAGVGVISCDEFQKGPARSGSLAEKGVHLPGQSACSRPARSNPEKPGSSSLLQPFSCYQVRIQGDGQNPVRKRRKSRKPSFGPEKN